MFTASDKTTVPKHRQCHNTIKILHTILLLNKELFSHQRKHKNWVYAHRIPWSYHAHHCLRTACLVEEQNGLLKTQPVRWNILQNWSKLPRRMCMLWISIQYMLLFPPIARIYGSMNKNVKMRMAPLVIISSNPLGKKNCFLFPSLMLLPWRS